MTLGERLIELRKQSRMSREEAAELLHVDRETLARYERGNRKPQSDFISIAAQVYRVSADYLLGLSAPSEDKKSAPAGMAANGGDNYGIQLNNSENNGTISQTTVSNAPASIAVDADLEAALRLRLERPEIIKLLADKDFTAAQIRALASAPRDEKDKD